MLFVKHFYLTDALAAHQRIVARSAEVEAKTGIQPSSVELIRQLRADEGRRD